MCDESPVTESLIYVCVFVMRTARGPRAQWWPRRALGPTYIDAVAAGGSASLSLSCTHRDFSSSRALPPFYMPPSCEVLLLSCHPGECIERSDSGCAEREREREREHVCTMLCGIGCGILLLFPCRRLLPLLLASDF